ncbi:MAG: AraC family transcriptional regulator ligand-binding domain-containing protein [Arenimonas sp.]
MNTWTTTSIASRYLVELLDAAGKPVDDVLADAGLTREVLIGPELAMPLGAFRELWARVASIKPGIGITLVELFPVGQMHMLAHLAMRSPNVAAAVHDVCRYAGVNSSADLLTLEQHGDSARFSYDCLADGPKNPWMAEHYLSMAVVFLARATGKRLPIRAVEFATQAQAPLEVYRQRFGVEPRFETGSNAIEFDLHALTWPLLTHDNYLHGVLERLAKLHNVAAPDSLLDKVRDDIAKSLLKGKAPSIETVAATCRLSPRALRDRLAQLQTTFRRSLDEVRRDLVQEHFARGLSVTETAYLLGFSEPAALQHACKRWFKQSAGEVRQHGKSR